MNNVLVLFLQFYYRLSFVKLYNLYQSDAIFFGLKLVVVFHNFLIFLQSYICCYTWNLATHAFSNDIWEPSLKDVSAKNILILLHSIFLFTKSIEFSKMFFGYLLILNSSNSGPINTNLKLDHFDCIVEA